MAATAPPKGGGNVFTRHIGPLPMWVWLAIVSAAVLAWALISRKGASPSTSADQSAATTPEQIIQVFPPNQAPATDDDDTSPEDHHHRHQPRPPVVDPGGPMRPPGGGGPGPKPVPVKRKPGPIIRPNPGGKVKKKRPKRGVREHPGPVER